MQTEEQQQRYEQAKCHAAEVLLGFLDGSRTAAETLEAIEITVLWRLVLEGQPVRPNTLERMMRIAT